MSTSITSTPMGPSRWVAAPEVHTGVSRTTTRPMPLDPQRILTGALTIIALALLNLGGNIGSAVFFIILLYMVFQSPESAYKALAICFLALMINMAFVPKSLVWTPSRIALPILALIRFTVDLSHLRTPFVTRGPYVALVLYVLTMAVCSILGGWYTQIALLKLFNFWLFLTCIMAGIAVLRSRKSDISEWFVSLITASTLFGVLSIVLGVSNNFIRLRTGSKEIVGDVTFNGAFLHPNCHSLYASLFVLFLASLYIFAPYRRRLFVIPMIALWCVFIALSQSRTAALSVAVSVMILFRYAQPSFGRFGRKLQANVRRPTLLAATILMAITLLFADAATDRKVTKSVVAFFNKAGAADNTKLDTDLMLNSRRGLIEYSWKNFLDKPIHGIGFQVSMTEAFVRGATLFTAPSEKGFLPTALLEEGGILGTSMFIVFITALIWPWVRERNLPAVIVFSGFFISNFGEVSIFSPGGSGAFGWIMVGAAVILGDHCWRSPTVVSRLHPSTTSRIRRVPVAA